MSSWKKSTLIFWLVLLAVSSVLGYLGYALLLPVGIAVVVAAFLIMNVGLWIEKNEEERRVYHVVGFAIMALGSGMVLGSILKILTIALGLDPCLSELC